MPQHRKIAILAGTLALAVAPAAAVAAPDKGGKAPSCKKQSKKKCPTVKEGRFTGHGQAFNYAGFDKVQWEFRNSVCNENRFPDLKVEFGSNKFILKAYSSPLQCLDTPADEGQPKAGFDTIRGQGTGTLNGASGATASFRFTDAGEPGVNDTATITIMRPDGTVALFVDNVKIQDGGNHQAHK